MQVRMNATRMELLKQRKRHVMALRGHRLLKNKRDEMMHRFLDLVEQMRGLRQRVEEQLIQGLQSFLAARAEMSREFLNEALMLGANHQGLLQVEMESVMNVLVPRFQLGELPDIYSYGFATTSAQLDEALGALAEVFPEMVKLAQVEQAIALLADEIEKTRRRVNALEQILLPQLEANIKFIRNSLDEMERSSRAQLIRFKEKVSSEGR